MSIEMMEAVVHWATLEVRILAIEQEMMGRGIYSQILQEDLFARDEESGAVATPLEPRGDIWGWVNACPTDSCRNATNHVHVVGEVGGELRLDVVPEWAGDIVGRYPQLFLAD